jgi:hypothetical protein
MIGAKAEKATNCLHWAQSIQQILDAPIKELWSLF